MEHVKVNYKSLWKLLIDKEVSKAELRKQTQIASSTMSKMANNEHVSLDVLARISLRRWMRIHVEKSIEDALLNGIVLRYRKSVQTQGRIMWLSEITQEDCQLIDDMMTKYSYYDHSMSDDAPLQEFTLEEIEHDVEHLIDWLTDINKRRNKK